MESAGRMLLERKSSYLIKTSTMSSLELKRASAACADRRITADSRPSIEALDRVPGTGSWSSDSLVAGREPCRLGSYNARL